MSVNYDDNDTSMVSNISFDASQFTTITNDNETENDTNMSSPNKINVDMASKSMNEIIDNNNGRNILFNEHLTNIKSLLENKPYSLQEANQQYLRLVGKKNDDLSYISSSEIRELYKYQSSKHGSHAGHEMMVDIGIIGHMASWSGVDILCMF